MKTTCVACSSTKGDQAFLKCATQLLDCPQTTAYEVDEIHAMLGGGVGLATALPLAGEGGVIGGPAGILTVLGVGVTLQLASEYAKGVPVSAALPRAEDPPQHCDPEYVFREYRRVKEDFYRYQKEVLNRIAWQSPGCTSSIMPADAERLADMLGRIQNLIRYIAWICVEGTPELDMNQFVDPTKELVKMGVELQRALQFATCVKYMKPGDPSLWTMPTKD